jgi:hypothetical protein
LQFQSVELDPHLRQSVLVGRVVGERSAGDRDRALGLQPLGGDVERPPSGGVVDVREPDFAPRVDREHEQIHAGEAGRKDARDAMVRRDDAVEDGVIATGGAHAERVPRLNDLEAVAVTGHEGVHDARRRGIGGVHRVEPESRPHRGHRSEALAPMKAPAAVHSFGSRRRIEQREIVARLGVSGGEHLSRRRVGQDPFDRPVTGASGVGGRSDPVQVHVQRDRVRGSEVGETALLEHHLFQRETGATQVRRDRHDQVSSRSQLLEVLAEESVLTVVARCPLGEPGEHVVGKPAVSQDGFLLVVSPAQHVC